MLSSNATGVISKPLTAIDLFTDVPKKFYLNIDIMLNFVHLF